MVFKYQELKQYIKEDFDEFYKRFKFNDKQIYLAILDEYIYGGDPSGVKYICIYVFIIINYMSENMNVEKIYAELKQRIDRVGIEVVRQELNEEYKFFLEDMNMIESEIKAGEIKGNG
ncbi:MAG: hypothetical protein NC300_06945 [Bacteroidales bacterium]|nr:hypothetical protein [Clostridium sp.]MCM1203864.1 hypothetical protein [Bacteroidales bacterium]